MGLAHFTHKHQPSKGRLAQYVISQHSQHQHRATETEQLAKGDLQTGISYVTLPSCGFPDLADSVRLADLQRKKLKYISWCLGTIE